MIDFVRSTFRLSIRRARRAVPACRATYHYRSRRPEQAPLRKRIREIAETRMRYGSPRITVLLWREPGVWVTPAALSG
jgi:putative transposase